MIVGLLGLLLSFWVRDGTLNTLIWFGSYVAIFWALAIINRIMKFKMKELESNTVLDQKIKQQKEEDFKLYGKIAYIISILVFALIMFKSLKIFNVEYDGCGYAENLYSLNFYDEKIENGEYRFYKGTLEFYLEFKNNQLKSAKSRVYDDLYEHKDVKEFTVNFGVKKPV